MLSGLQSIQPPLLVSVHHTHTLVGLRLRKLGPSLPPDRRARAHPQGSLEDTGLHARAARLQHVERVRGGRVHNVEHALAVRGAERVCRAVAVARVKARSKGFVAGAVFSAAGRLPREVREVVDRRLPVERELALVLYALTVAAAAGPEHVLVAPARLDHETRLLVRVEYGKALALNEPVVKVVTPGRARRARAPIEHNRDRARGRRLHGRVKVIVGAFLVVDHDLRSLGDMAAVRNLDGGRVGIKGRERAAREQERDKCESFELHDSVRVDVNVSGLDVRF